MEQRVRKTHPALPVIPLWGNAHKKRENSGKLGTWGEMVLGAARYSGGTVVNQQRGKLCLGDAAD